MYHDGKNINDEIVSAGHAVYRYEQNPKSSEGGHLRVQDITRCDAA